MCWWTDWNLTNLYRCRWLKVCQHWNAHNELNRIIRLLFSVISTFNLFLYLYRSMISFPAYLFSCALEGKSSMFNYFGMLILYSKYVRSVVKEKTNKFVSIGGNWNDFFGQINEEKSWASFVFTVSYIGLPIFLSFFCSRKLAQRKLREKKKSLIIIIDIKYSSIPFHSFPNKVCMLQNRTCRMKKLPVSCSAHIVCAQILIFTDLLLDKMVAHLLHRCGQKQTTQLGEERARIDQCKKIVDPFSAEISLHKANSVPVDIKIALAGQHATHICTTQPK